MVTIRVNGGVGAIETYEIIVEAVSAQLAGEQMRQALDAVIKALQVKKDATE